MTHALLLALTLFAQEAEPASTASADAAGSEAVVTSDAFDPEAALDRINAALNDVETLRANFTQVSPDGTAEHGVLSLRRPGRLRFEYAEPSPLLVVAGGGTVAIRDAELGTTDRAPLRSTPLWWLLKDEVDLAADAEIVSLWEEDGFVYATLADPDGEMDGEVVFLFDAATYQLTQWFAVDSLGLTTRVMLEDIETGIDLDPRLFVLEDDTGDRRDRRR
ncbi:LolA family protein [Hyphobacterium marinum]|uniref:Outer membrane lipoprotein carrier protein LolA n=1 Tax=Hyphobacterium marinum TaxID=3116574 RepID=A0ABU7LUW4_9PROT|nr:outer membrane lipoprotein carrier protein LolA [Hyphobacterium sp. Y6023]MEE2565348.1 outer membrane lipoprotein carrier protein LolA [Hyphobacterium sp. Y6023]